MDYLIAQLPVLGPFLTTHTMGKGMNSDVILFGGFVRWFHEQAGEDVSLDAFMKTGSDVDVFVHSPARFAEMIQDAGDRAILEYSATGYECEEGKSIFPKKIENWGDYPRGSYFLYVPMPNDKWFKYDVVYAANTKSARRRQFREVDFTVNQLTYPNVQRDDIVKRAMLDIRERRIVPATSLNLKMIHRAQKLLNKGYQFHDDLFAEVFVHQCRVEVQGDGYIYAGDISTPSILDTTQATTEATTTPTLAEATTTPTLAEATTSNATSALRKYLHQTRHPLERLTSETACIKNAPWNTPTPSEGVPYYQSLADNLTRLYKTAVCKDKRLVLVELEIPSNARRYIKTTWDTAGPTLRVSCAMVRGFYSYGCKKQLPDDLVVRSLHDPNFSYPMNALVSDERASPGNRFGIYGVPCWQLLSIYGSCPTVE